MNDFFSLRSFEIGDKVVANDPEYPDWHPVGTIFGFCRLDGEDYAGVNYDLWQYNDEILEEPLRMQYFPKVKCLYGVS